MGTSFDKKVCIYVPFMSQMPHLCTIYVPFMSHLCPKCSIYVPFMFHLCPPDLPPDRLHIGQVRQGCASWARNPKGPKITPFWHQMGRHPTVFQTESGLMRRISARISPDRSPPHQSQLFLRIFGSKIVKTS